jgi:hypothetical protein
VRMWGIAKLLVPFLRFAHLPPSLPDSNSESLQWGAWELGCGYYRKPSSVPCLQAGPSNLHTYFHHITHCDVYPTWRRASKPKWMKALMMTCNLWEKYN